MVVRVLSITLGNGKYGPQLEHLPVTGETWEDNVNSIVTGAFEPLGLRVEVCNSIHVSLFSALSPTRISHQTHLLSLALAGNIAHTISV
jgi:hypothetical protein